MNSPLTRALIRLGAVLVGFALLAGVIVWVTFSWVDRELLSGLQAVPGVWQVDDQGSRVEVRLDPELTPADAQLATDSVRTLAKQQQVFRARPVELVQGALHATMTASPPSVPPGDFRGDMGQVLSRRTGIVSGELTSGDGVLVTVPPMGNLLGWTLDAAADLEVASVPAGTLTVTDGTTWLRLVSSSPADRQLLLDGYSAVADAGGTVTSMTAADGNLDGPLSGQFGAADRRIAAAMTAGLAALVSGDHAKAAVTVEIADDLRLHGLGDAAPALALTDRLSVGGLDVTEVWLDLQTVRVEAATPEALDDLLGQIGGDGWNLAQNGRVACTLGPGGGTVSGTTRSLPENVALAQSMWRAGYPDVSVGDGQARDASNIRIGFTSNADHDYRDRKEQRSVSEALRTAGWQGRAHVSVQGSAADSPLTFYSTATGRAEPGTFPSKLGGFGKRRWATRFIDVWNDTATT